MKSDIRDIQPAEEGIPFSAADGTEYVLPKKIPSCAHLEMLDKWDDLVPFMASKGSPEDTTPEGIEHKAAVMAKADKAIRHILWLMARDKYPFMTPEWFSENLDALELMALSAEVLMKASDFFVRRREKLARLTTQSQDLLRRAQG